MIKEILIVIFFCGSSELASFAASFVSSRKVPPQQIKWLLTFEPRSFQSINHSYGSMVLEWELKLTST